MTKPIDPIKRAAQDAAFKVLIAFSDMDELYCNGFITDRDEVFYRLYKALDEVMPLVRKAINYAEGYEQ